VASSDHRPRRIHDHDQLIQAVIDGLCRAGIMRHDDEVLAADVLPIDPAYVIYDLDYHENVKTIHQWLLSQGIQPCGRFGDWEYYNMDHSMMSGKRAAEEIAATEPVT
jgi:UDP-galactopyranose mutase